MLASRPFSFIPSEEAISQELVITLPYLDFHLTEPLPTSPVRSIPLGNIHKLAGISPFQSIERAVITIPLGPLYTTLVQASVVPIPNKSATVNTSGNFTRVLNFFMFYHF